MNTQEQIDAILKDLSNKEELHDSDRLQDELFFDSLTLITLLMALEDAFEIEFCETDMDPLKLNTVGDIRALVEKYQGGDAK